MTKLRQADWQHVWHPFTRLPALENDPADAAPHIVITEAEGVILRDENGKEYLDGNASIWTCLHGHSNPRLLDAVTQQLRRLDHCSSLGLANDQAALLAQELIAALDLPRGTRVFFSSDGSSAVEAGLKILHQSRQLRGEHERKKFITFSGAYHGDTVGAMSLSHSPIFHSPFADLMFEAHSVAAPTCYRCPHNRAAPERGSDARLTRKCNWECVTDLTRAIDLCGAEKINALIVEPRLQGAAGFLMHPHGYQQRIRPLLEERGIWLMADEVLTGMGRCGPLSAGLDDGAQTQVIALGKSLSGGVMPLAATIIVPEVAAPFTTPQAPIFYHGHSYSGHPPACAAARASLDILHHEHDEAYRKKFADMLREASEIFWQLPHVGDVRQEGGVLAIELVEHFATRKKFDPHKKLGAAVCAQAAELGLLTRPVGDCLVLMPPLCAKQSQIELMCELLRSAISKTLLK